MNKTYLIDLDGTMYRGTDIIEGAKEFVDYLKGKYVPVYVDKKNSRNYFVDTYPVIDIYLRNRR